MEHESKPLAGGLYVAATPIGNLADITLRVLDSLKQADLILAEDTRKTNQLLNHYKIKNKLKSFRVHRLKEDISSTITELLAGKSVVFVTDAGTPGISDPVSHLVRQIREQKLPIPITALPGASALTAALSISGWQVNPTLFAGFLSPKSGKRRKSIEQMLQFDGLIVIYESVHRIDKLLAELVEIHPNRPILVTRELTKLHQECIEIEPGGPIPDFVRKGEFTVILGERITKK
ncbi:MAG: 16S rRNA (cytidine(1402)-2'-O)-methyltransferase [Leptonema sp. (in: Bacteria)]|nr:16S rRNA (cytidine(1402)-2'-O)-methyltransferase [Leptonema sp. (in: bacteria)]